MMTLSPDKEYLAGLSISRIREITDSAEPGEELLALLEQDSRAGVRALASRVRNCQAREASLRARQEELLAIERKLSAAGKKGIAGVDEAGRGPLAGPVVAAAVILPEDLIFPGLDDSKKVSAHRREELFERITGKAVAWGIGMADNDEIDEIGILAAAMKAMRNAVGTMKVEPDIVLVDGNQSPKLACEEMLVVNGDARCRCIAAASIIAKVTRDRIMVEMDRLFPGYGFARHKGYGASRHVAALREKGPCTIHRFSFKIVPQAAPPGTATSVLRERLSRAPTREALERISRGIARIRDNLAASDLEELRACYKRCVRRFGEVHHGR